MAFGLFSVPSKLIWDFRVELQYKHNKIGYYTGLNDFQDAFVTGVTNFLPVGTRGFVLEVAMAATMSVASGTILACSTIVYNDLYIGFMKKEKTTSLFGLIG